MKKMALQVLTAVFALNMTLGVLACSGGGCGKKEEEEKPKQTDTTSKQPSGN